MNRCLPHRRGVRAFTLVELLVVIGIIAILVGVLLPSLVSVRRSAQTVKCSAALSEIGNCFKLYSIDNKGYYPPMWCRPNYAIYFPGNPPTMYNTSYTYWMYFLAKYSTHSNISASGNSTDISLATQSSILWGCPNFVPVAGTGALSNNGIQTVYTGYGMNGYPEYTSTFPAVSGNQYDVIGDGITPTNTGLVASVITTDNWQTYTGKWYKYSAWTNPAERALVGDCIAYNLEAFKATSACRHRRPRHCRTDRSIRLGMGRRHLTCTRPNFLGLLSPR